MAFLTRGEPGVRASRFLSVSWKVVLIAGAMLVLATTAFTWQLVANLQKEEAGERVRHRSRDADLTTELIKHETLRLQSLGTLVSVLPGLREALREGREEALRKTFDPFWSEVSLAHDLYQVVFVAADGRLVGTWGEGLRDGRPQALLLDAARAERPMFQLDCESTCRFLMAVPFVDKGQSLGGVLLSVGLQGFIMNFRNLSGDELALLLVDADSRKPALPAYGARLLSVSGGSRFEELVRALGPEHRRGDSYEIASGGRYYHAYLIPAPSAYRGRAHLLVIADITAEETFIRDDLRNNLFWGAAIFVLAMLALYLALRPTMNRVRAAARTLPMLGEGRYQEARAVLENWQVMNTRDELDELVDHARGLTEALEGAQARERRHTEALAAQAAQTVRERDFVSSLLETAPVIILSYGDDARIRLANAHATLTSGLRSELLLGRPFPDLFLEASQRVDHLFVMESLAPGEVRTTESSVVRGDGQRRDVVWFHSCVVDPGGRKTFLSVGLDVTEHRRAERSLTLLADRDVVTGLLNRLAFKRELGALLAGGESGAVLVCDLDEFRLVNDQLGNEVGDAVLADCARHILEIDPVPVVAARLGSDEFALAFVGVTAADVIALARRFNQHMPQVGGANEGVLRHHLSACHGLVMFPEHGAGVDELLGNAEIALTQARAKGHGSWHLYSAEDTHRETAGRRAHWRGEIEAALEEGRFLLHFQPIVHVMSGMVSHYEVLLRMRDRDGGLVAPGMFIDVAETTGLIRRIDRWVIEQTVAVAAARPEVKLALNLSSRSFDDDLAFETMQAALADSGVPGKRLLLEITETAALANFVSATRIMAKLRGLGCAFGLDDFGVGYSSFQYLKELPVDFVKIDGSFIKNLTRNPDDVVFVRALNDAVQGFGKVTVAEFVEDQATLDILRDIGVDYAQGYHFGRPAPEIA